MRAALDRIDGFSRALRTLDLVDRGHTSRHLARPEVVHSSCMGEVLLHHVLVSGPLQFSLLAHLLGMLMLLLQLGCLLVLLRVGFHGRCAAYLLTEFVLQALHLSHRSRLTLLLLLELVWVALVISSCCSL